MYTRRAIRYVALSLHSSPAVKWLVGITVCTGLILVFPFRPIRLGLLHADSLGGFIAQADLALALDPPKERSRRSTTQFIVLPENQANEFVVSLYSDVFARRNGTKVLVSAPSLRGKILETAALGLEHVALRHPWLRSRYCGSPTWEGIDACGFEEDGRPWIAIPAETQTTGRELLHAAGIDTGRPIICFNVRDSSYWRSRAAGKGDIPGGGSTQDFRNVRIEAYLPALEQLTQKGYEVVRMGAGANPCDALGEIGVKDYANSSCRSDALDALLFSECSGAIFGGASGIAQLALAFHKPVCVLDYRPFIFTEWSTPICHLTPSLLRDSRSDRTLTLAEMLRHPYNVQSLYQAAGLEFIANTSDEISSSIEEFLCLLNSTGSPFALSATQDLFWTTARRERPSFAWYPRANGGVMKRRSRFTPSQHGWTARQSVVSESFLSAHARELFG